VRFLAAIAEKWPDRRKKVAMKNVWLKTLNVMRGREEAGEWEGERYGKEPRPP
jgi:hypothetical protein